MNSGPCNSFYCLGHLNNVYDDDLACVVHSCKPHDVYDLKQCRPIFTVVFMSVVELAASNASVVSPDSCRSNIVTCRLLSVTGMLKSTVFVGLS